MTRRIRGLLDEKRLFEAVLVSKMEHCRASLGCWLGSFRRQAAQSLAQRDRWDTGMGLWGGEKKKAVAKRSAVFTLATPTPTKISVIFGTDLVVTLVIFLLYLGLPYAVCQSFRTPIRPHNTRVLSLGSNSNLATEVGRRITSFHRVPFTSHAGDFPCSVSRCASFCPKHLTKQNAGIR